MTPPTTTLQRITARLALSVVALVAAVASYAHMYEVAVAAGEEWRAWLLPLSVDGLVVSASLGAWQARRRGEPVPTMTAVSLMAGLAASLGANVVAPFLPWLIGQAGDLLAALVAAWPAVALGLAFEELMRQARPGDTADTAGEATPAPAVEDVDTDTAPDRPSVDTTDTAPAPVSADTGGTDTASAEPIDTTTATPVVGDVRDEARRYVRDCDRRGVRISGRELGERYGRAEAWGRNQIRIVRQESAERERPALVAVEA